MQTPLLAHRTQTYANTATTEGRFCAAGKFSAQKLRPVRSDFQIYTYLCMHVYTHTCVAPLLYLNIIHELLERSLSRKGVKRRRWGTSFRRNSTRGIERLLPTPGYHIFWSRFIPLCLNPLTLSANQTPAQRAGGGAAMRAHSRGPRERQSVPDVRVRHMVRSIFYNRIQSVFNLFSPSGGKTCTYCRMIYLEGERFVNGFMK